MMLLFLITLVWQTNAQYQSKLEINTLVIYNTNIPPRVFTMDDGNKVDISGDFFGYGVVGFYNINSKISLGAKLQKATSSGGALINSAYSEILSDSETINTGVLVKYNIIDKKRFKFYTKASVDINMHNLSFEGYYYLINMNNNLQSDIYFDSPQNNPKKKYTSLGVEVAIGTKIYILNNAGVVLNLGYFNNGFLAGATSHGGLFIDLIK
jgi:hypothetical protein